MSVKIEKPSGRFGNQLCSYFLGKIISENLKFKLYGPNAKSEGFALDNMDTCYDNPDHNSYDNPIQRLGGLSLSNDLCHPDFDIFQIINDKTPRKIILDGYFQKKKFYTPFREDIIKWFNPKKYETSHNDLAIHIRIGDLRLGHNTKHLLPYEYYIHNIENIPHEKLFICTDSPNDCFVKFLNNKYKAETFIDNEKNTISFLSSHNNLVLSQGTFSFWASFLCNGLNIVNAIPKTGWNSLNERCDIDLLLESERHKYIKL